MSLVTERELQRRVDDLENALRTIGRMATDATVQPSKRIQRVVGIVEMYDCGPRKEA